MAFHCIRCKREIEPQFKACPHCGEPVTDFLRRYADAPLDGKYELLDRLGTGGMGEVYKVRHTYLGNVRVVKVIRPQISESRDVNDRFLREARLATKVQHPNVATLHDFSALPDGAHYMVWEFIDGENLAQLLRRGVLQPRQAVRLAIEALHGLEAIHRAGIVHRDISPENLMITRGDDGSEQVKIIDLGVAKTDSESSDTRTGMFLGKLRYSSPEHLGFLEEDEKIDGRADLYSMGIVLFEMLTGRAPFEATSPHQYILMHSRDTKFERLNLPPSLPGAAALQSVLDRALEHDRRRRYASARELATALAAVEQTLPEPVSGLTMPGRFDPEATMKIGSTPTEQGTTHDTLQRTTQRTDRGAERLPVATQVTQTEQPSTIDQRVNLTAVPDGKRPSRRLVFAGVAIVLLSIAAAAAFFLPAPSSAPSAATATASMQKSSLQARPAQSTLDVVTQSAPTPSAGSSTDSAPQAIANAPASRGAAESRSEAPASHATAAPEPPVGTYIEGSTGDGVANEQALTTLQQELHGVTHVTVRGEADPSLEKELANLLGRDGVTVGNGADVTIAFNGRIEHLSFGRKRRSAHAVIARSGRVVFRYELPAEEYRVGDDPAEAFHRVIRDAFSR